MEVGPGVMGWGTWEELILASAVLRHGTQDWNVVVSELRARTVYPHCYTPLVCKAKYEDLQKRYSGSTAWFEELRKRRLAELKQELAKSEDSIGSLESKIKSMETDKQHSNQADYGAGQTESPLPVLNSDETENTRTSTSWLHERQDQEMETYIKPGISVSSHHQYEDLSIIKEANSAQGVTVRKQKRGLRKRKDCNWAIKESSACDSDNLGSSNVVFTTQRETSTNQIVGNVLNVKIDDSLMGIFKSIAQSEPAVVFRHRMDSQKRAKYRKVIKQHLDMGTIRSKIIAKSIKSAKDLFRDLLLLSNNALVFYSKRTREYKSAQSLRNLIMKEYKQQCIRSSHEAISAFWPLNPPVKPRSARPHLRSRLPTCKGTILEKFFDTENVDNATMKSMVKPELVDIEGLKKNELADTRPKMAPVKRRKRVRK